MTKEEKIKAAKNYFNRYFKNDYIKETDTEFKQLIAILNRAEKQKSEGEKKGAKNTCSFGLNPKTCIRRGDTCFGCVLR